MAKSRGIKAFLTNDNDFYRKHYAKFLIGLMLVILLLLSAVGFVLYQLFNRPLPPYYAIQTTDTTKRMSLTAFTEPNLLPDTILRWASKAATTAYSFDFINYNAQIGAARSYFTEPGWQDFLRSVNPVVEDIVRKQLFVNGVVSGTPIVSNQGPLPGRGYTWRIQIPFLVTYQSGNAYTKQDYLVLITIVRVPTAVNPQGIGIDQFVMV